MNTLRRKDILSLDDWDRAEILAVLDNAASFKEVLGRPIKKVPTLRGKSVATLFYEASTRTRASFELAAKVMSADAVNLTGTSSSTPVTPQRRRDCRKCSCGGWGHSSSATHC